MKKIKKNLTGLLAMALMVISMCIPVLATGADSANANYKAEAEKMLSPMYFVVYLVEGAVVIAGILGLIFGIVKLVQSIQTHDQSGIPMAIVFIVGGLVLAGVGTVLALFGVNL